MELSTHQLLSKLWCLILRLDGGQVHLSLCNRCITILTRHPPWCHRKQPLECSFQVTFNSIMHLMSLTQSGEHSQRFCRSEDYHLNCCFLWCEETGVCWCDSETLILPWFIIIRWDEILILCVSNWSRTLGRLANIGKNYTFYFSFILTWFGICFSDIAFHKLISQWNKSC